MTRHCIVCGERLRTGIKYCWRHRYIGKDPNYQEHVKQKNKIKGVIFLILCVLAITVSYYYANQTYLNEAFKHNSFVVGAITGLVSAVLIIALLIRSIIRKSILSFITAAGLFLIIFGLINNWFDWVVPTLKLIWLIIKIVFFVGLAALLIWTIYYFVTKPKRENERLQTIERQKKEREQVLETLYKEGQISKRHHHRKNKK